jgi:hypothetical protein
MLISDDMKDLPFCEATICEVKLSITFNYFSRNFIFYSTRPIKKVLRNDDTQNSLSRSYLRLEIFNKSFLFHSKFAFF